MVGVVQEPVFGPLVVFGLGGAATDMLLRVSRLADDLPEVAELELNPVLATPGGARILAARIRVGPA
jgi:acyl-CoA synthetase (NDP forming)